MIVLGIDPHKKSHTAVAVEAATGELLGELTVPATVQGHARLLTWARTLAPARRFALEDCRHVSGRLERFLVERGESCVRVPPKLMAQTRRSARTRGKSDPIDATAVARAALREPGLPEARLAGPERELRLLADHRDDLVAERTRIQGRLRWHLHDLGLGSEIPPKALRSTRWLDCVEAQLDGLEGVQARVARELTSRCRALNAEIGALEHEVGALAGALRECGPVRHAQRRRPRTGLERQERPLPPQPPRQPPPQLRPAPHRRHADPHARPGARLHRAQTRRGQDQA